MERDVITASVGQKVTYTITSKVPQNTQYYSDYGYTYTDTPSAGQTVDFDSLKVTVGDKSLNKGTGYTVAKGENGKFTVNITSIKQQNAGDEIVVTYDAEVTEAEATGRKAVTNTVVLSDNGAKATDSTFITNGQSPSPRPMPRAMLWLMLILRSRTERCLDSVHCYCDFRFKWNGDFQGSCGRYLQGH